MRIAQVSFAERAGGAERVALELHHAFRAAGHDAVLLTPRPRCDAAGQPVTPGVIGVDIHAGRPAPLRALSRIDHRLARPLASLRRRLGYDDFHHPWTASLLDLLPWTPDVLHLHNLHGGWFDLRRLVALSEAIPTFLTLHDAAWLTGGPHFPFLARHWPRRVLTHNRRVRHAVFKRSKLHVVTPSAWMRDLIAGSELEAAAIRQRVIPYGVDTSVFSPGENGQAKSRLGVASGSPLILGVALTGRGRFSHKDPETAIASLDALDRSVSRVTCCLLGSVGPDSEGSGFTLLYRDVIHDRKELAEAYRSADVLIHAAHEDNFPNVVLEAQACGLPCVVTDRGGMREQVLDGETGWVVPAHDPAAMGAAVSKLLTDGGLREAMSRNAVAHARDRFPLGRMTGDYLTAFSEARV